MLMDHARAPVLAATLLLLVVGCSHNPEAANAELDLIDQEQVVSQVGDQVRLDRMLFFSQA